MRTTSTAVMLSLMATLALAGCAAMTPERAERQRYRPVAQRDVVTGAPHAYVDGKGMVGEFRVDIAPDHQHAANYSIAFYRRNYSSTMFAARDSDGTTFEAKDQNLQLVYGFLGVAGNINCLVIDVGRDYFEAHRDRGASFKVSTSSGKIAPFYVPAAAFASVLTAYDAL